jgi:hypothetical protein
VTAADSERFREIYEKWVAQPSRGEADLAQQMARSIRQANPTMDPAKAMRDGWGHARLIQLADGGLTDAELPVAVRFVGDGMHPADAIKMARAVLS